MIGPVDSSDPDNARILGQGDSAPAALTAAGTENALPRGVLERDGEAVATLVGMEFRRINALPPYVFGIMDALKIEARRAGVDVVDLGFGNPDVPSPDVAVDKLVEAVRNPRNHRYSASRGIPKLRMADRRPLPAASSASRSTPTPRCATPSAPRRASPT